MARAERKNVRIAALLGGIAVGMVGMSFAAVPLYDLFCRVTGYGGTTQQSDAGSDRITNRQLSIRFNADHAPDLPWHFKPVQNKVRVNVGENRLVFYQAENLSDREITGMAVYNVTPLKAGIYFHKVQCFCFNQQTLQPGEAVDMPVSFYIDPEFDDDPEMDNIKTITLSYTFYNQSREAQAEPQITASTMNRQRTFGGE
jgi:cytochrome c oxidase assembly protein subunit 11